MCRWIAYRGETTSFEPYVTEPEHSLIAQSIRSLQSTAGSNGDGFGSAGTASIRSPAFIARHVRPGRTKICATSAAICARICSSPMCAPPPARR